MSAADDEAMMDPFKQGVLTTLMLIGKVLQDNPTVDTGAVISDVEKLIAAMPLGDKPLTEQDQHTLPLRWLLSGLR